MNTETTSSPTVNETHIGNDLGHDYVLALKQLEKYQKIIDDSEAVDLMLVETTQAGYALLNLVETLALYGKAITANLDLVLSRLPDTNPEFAELRRVRLQLGSVYAGESTFCDNMERMHLARELEGTGIDVNDRRAVHDYLSKIGKNLVFVPQPPNN